MTRKHIALSKWFENINSHKSISNSDEIVYALKLCHLDLEKNPNHLISTNSLIYTLVDTLLKLNINQSIIATAMLYSQYNSSEKITKDTQTQIGANLASLLISTVRLNIIDEIFAANQDNKKQLEKLHHLVIAILDDPRAVLIKLAEQLYKLNLLVNTKERDPILVKKIFQVYVPIANKLGIGNLKAQLEELAFSINHSTTYNEISKNISSSKTEQNIFIKNKIKELKPLIKQLKISNFKIYGRVKHIYSIYHKMTIKKISLAQMYDLIAIRILVPNIQNCYEALSVIHQHWKYIPTEFNDYIAHPKLNGYRSLHTTVTEGNSHRFEIQIRTYQMYEEAEYGIAAHWYYKEGGQRNKIIENKIIQLRSYLEWQNQQTEGQKIAKKTFLTSVYLITPLNEIVVLPKGSTPIDFAYHIHTEIGHRCKGARINGHIKPLTHRLKSGDKIEIITSKNSSPSRDWLLHENNYTKTHKAKLKIITWFKEHDLNIYIEIGKKKISSFIKSHHIKNTAIDQVVSDLNYKNMNLFWADLGRNKIDLTSLFPTNNPQNSFVPKPLPATISTLNNLLTHVARCCNPTTNDKIMGRISTRRGIAIHKIDCPNIQNISPEHKNRLIVLSWDSNIV